MDNKEDISIEPNQNISELPFVITQSICSYIDLEHGLVQKLIAASASLSHCYTFSDVEVHKILNPPNDEGICVRLFKILGSRGMTASELVQLLDRFQLERCLEHLVFPSPLKLMKDIPEKMDITEGDTLVLECIAVGFPYPRYVWYRNKSKITQNRIGKLEIKNVGLNDTGLYVCCIHQDKKGTNLLSTSKCAVYVMEDTCAAFSNMTITSVPVSVPVPPNSILFKRQPPKNIILRRGEVLKIDLEAVGKPPIKYLWCKDGEILTELSDQPLLHINSVSARDSGIYQCLVSNQGPNDVKSRECCVTVVFEQPGNVSGRPVIISQPMSKQEYIGGTTVFRVEASCVIPMKYQWYHNGVRMSEPGCSSNELNFKIQSLKQAGDYQCQISTDSDDVMSNVAKLEITKPRSGKVYHATDKIAICLGQSTYRANSRQLPAVKNDLYVAHQIFTKLGFKTISCLDNSLDEMNIVIDMAIDLMKDASNDQVYVALYLVGHGFLYNGVTYLMPINAQEGTQVSNCLSLDSIEARITRELNPALLLIIADVCQTQMDDVLQDDLPERCYGPYSKKKIIIRAASKEEEALEQSFNDHTMRAVAPVDDWTDLTPQNSCRGIFSKALFTVFEQSPTLTVQDIYKEFNRVFERPDPTISKGKQQNPQYEINIEEERSLSDQIKFDGQEIEYEKRESKYKMISQDAKDDCIALLPDEWLLRVTYNTRASNVLEVILYEEDKRALPHHVSMTYNIQSQSTSRMTRPCEFYQYPDEPSLRIRNKRGYIFYNLQRLQEPLKFTLEINNQKQDCKPTMKKFLFKLQYPLISRKWNHSQHSVIRTFPSNSTREACEHSEPDDRLSSIESFA